jgi:phosphoribosyl 1,2-cyclic phosphodiesterase
MRLRVLASGSSGNAALLTTHGDGRRHDLLIDLGLSPRRLQGLLQAEGTCLESLCGVLLTHGDVDHLHTGWARAWPTLLAPPIVLRAQHGMIPARAGLGHAAVRWAVEPLQLGPFHVEALPLPHDREGSTAFRVQAHDVHLGWATDLGHAPEGLLAFMGGVQALGIESNYDPRLQQASPRPEHLKRRIMDGHGHLSNEQALAFVRRLQDAGTDPLLLMLLHLSEQCNGPELVQDLWLRQAPDLAPRMRVAARRQPSPAVHLPSLLAST